MKGYARRLCEDGSNIASTISSLRPDEGEGQQPLSFVELKQTLISKLRSGSGVQTDEHGSTTEYKCRQSKALKSGRYCTCMHRNILAGHLLTVLFQLGEHMQWCQGLVCYILQETDTVI